MRSFFLLLVCLSCAWTLGGTSLAQERDAPPPGATGSSDTGNDSAPKAASQRGAVHAGHKGLRATRGAMLLELLEGRESLTPELHDQLQIAPSENGATTRLQVGSRSWALDDLVFLRVPEPSAPIRINKAWIMLLRSGDTLRGTITGSTDDAVRFLAAELERAPFEVPLDAIQALIAERSFQGRPGRLSYAPGAKARLLRRLRRLIVDTDVVLLRQQESSSAKAGRIDGIVESLANEGVQFLSLIHI